MVPMDAGLTNQKLALLGLALAAREAGRPLVLPWLTDFRPDRPDHPRRALATVLSNASIVTGFAGEGIAVVGAPVTDALPLDDPWPLFEAASAAVTAARRGGDAAEFARLCRLLAAMRPAPAIRRLARRMIALLGQRGIAIFCQLRIERDWRAYVETRLEPLLGATEDLYVPAERIFAKLAASELGGGGLYLACDEDDLAEDREAIRRQVRRDGREAMFMGDVLAALGETVASPLHRTALNAEIARALGCCIGHSRSTFFNMLALARHGEAGDGDGRAVEAHYLYNGKAPRLKRRTDDGAFVRPWLATMAG